MELRDLLSLLFCEQVNWFTGDDSIDGTFASPNDDWLSDEDLHVETANRIDIEKALFIDVLNHQTYLIAMTCQHDAGLSVRVDRCDYIAVDIRPHFIGIIFRPCSHHFLHWLLVA